MLTRCFTEATSDKETPFLLATAENRLRAFQVLLQVRPSSVHDNADGHVTAAHYAAMIGNTDMARILFEGWPELFCRWDDSENTPVTYAICRHHDGIVMMIWDSDPSMFTAGCCSDSTAAHLAAEWDFSMFVTTMVHRHPEWFRVQDKNGSTPLHKAAEGTSYFGRSVNTIQLMLQVLLAEEFGVCNHDGNSPMHLAVMSNERTGEPSVEMVKQLLVVLPATYFHVPNGEGKTARDYIAESTNPDLTALLMTSVVPDC